MPEFSRSQRIIASDMMVNVSQSSLLINFHNFAQVQVPAVDAVKEYSKFSFHLHKISATDAFVIRKF